MYYAQNDAQHTEDLNMKSFCITIALAFQLEVLWEVFL